MLEIVLTREDANSESALLAEWLADDRALVKKGRPICVVETSKASVEIEAPGDGILVQLVESGVEVELGTTIAVVAADEAEAEKAAERRVEPEPADAEPAVRNVTRRAAELAAEHGIDLSAIEKSGFVTAEDVEAMIRASSVEGPGALDPVFAGLSTENVTLPALFGLDEAVGRLDESFLVSLREDPAAFGALSSEEKCQRLRDAGARVGEGVHLGEGTVVIAPRIVLEDGVRIEAGGSVECAEVVAIGELSRFGPGLRLACRRAWIGSGLWGGARILIGGGGHRDPWATFVLGDDAFLGDEIFVNVCRPVLIGAETFTTMRSMLVTHNVGHSVLDGFENRFAGIVLEDRAQVGLGAVVYAGCRIGREAIVASNSYVVSDIPAGTLAVGVPAKPVGAAKRELSQPHRVSRARRMLHELHELLVLRGVEAELREADGVETVELTGEDGPGRVVFVESLSGGEVEAGEGETVVLTLGLAGDAPEGIVVFDLSARRVHGDASGVLADSVREFCRKRGIRLAPGPWRYTDGLI